MTVTAEQRDLAIKHAESLETVLRDGTVALLKGRSKPQEAIPILSRIATLLRAVGRDPGRILEEALEIVTGKEE